VPKSNYYKETIANERELEEFFAQPKKETKKPLKRYF